MSQSEWPTEAENRAAIAGWTVEQLKESAKLAIAILDGNPHDTDTNMGAFLRVLLDEMNTREG